MRDQMKIPNYYLGELERVKKVALDDQRDALFSALVIADTHIDYELLLNKNTGGHFWHSGNTGDVYRECDLIYRLLSVVTELANTTNVDCVIFGGDILHGCSNHERAIGFLSSVADILDACKVPVYASRGNHDLNDYHPNERIVTIEEWNALILDRLARGHVIHDESNEKSTYYYVDFADKKVRLVTLDAYNYPQSATDRYTAESWNKIDDTQLLWLAETALDSQKRDWTYIISSHAPLCAPESFLNHESVKEIVAAFNKREKITVCGKEIDYTNARGYIPLSISGHTHVASWRMFHEARHICINTSAARLAYYPALAETKSEIYTTEMPVRYEGTIAEAMLDIVTLKRDFSVIRRNFGPVSDQTFVLTDSGYQSVSQ